MKAGSTKRHVALVILAAGALLLKRSYHGPWAGLVHDYGGNLVASFAVYFVGTIATERFRRTEAAAALFALLVVESFELTNGFGVMTNVYDPVDLVANAVGVGLGLLADYGMARLMPRRTAT